jgi:hypothetical protein
MSSGKYFMHIHYNLIIAFLCAFELLYFIRDIMVLIIWLLDLQLPLQSVPITTKVVSLSPAHGEVYTTQYNIM